MASQVTISLQSQRTEFNPLRHVHQVGGSRRTLIDGETGRITVDGKWPWEGLRWRWHEARSLRK